MSTTEQIWRDFSTPLASFIRRRVASEQDAQDLLSDVFLRLQERALELEHIADPSAWLYRITRNAITDHHRRTHSGRSVELDDDLPERLDEGSVSELAHCLEELMETLPEDDRQSLRRIASGLTQEELAQREGLTSSGAKSRVQRARRRLIDRFRTCCRLEFDGVGRVVAWEKHDPSRSGPCH